MSNDNPSIDANIEPEHISDFDSTDESNAALKGNGESLPDTDIAAQEILSPEEQLSDEEQRQRLIHELDLLVARLQEATPDYNPTPFTPQGLKIELLQRNFGRFSPGIAFSVLGRLRSTISKIYLTRIPGRVSGICSIIRWTPRQT